MALDQARLQAEATDLQIRQQIAALETGLASLRAATTGSDPSALPWLVGEYADVETGAEQQFAAQADYLLQRQDWMNAKLASLASQEPTATAWISAKSNALKAMSNNSGYAKIKECHPDPDPVPVWHGQQQPAAFEL